MTGDPTSVQTMEKIETLVHLEFLMKNLFVRFFLFFFLKYNPSCDEF